MRTTSNSPKRCSSTTGRRGDEGHSEKPTTRYTSGKPFSNIPLARAAHPDPPAAGLDLDLLARAHPSPDRAHDHAARLHPGRYGALRNSQSIGTLLFTRHRRLQDRELRRRETGG